MALIYAIVNQKGGVGKTTTVAALGAALQDSGAAVLLVDLDPQASLTDALGWPDAPPVLYEAISGYIAGGEWPTNLISILTGGESLIPASIELAACELDLVSAQRREYVIADLLGSLPVGAFDFILLDCPPSLGLLTLNALTAADAVLIPVTPEHMAVRGLRLLLGTVARVKGKPGRPGLNPRLDVLGVLVTMLTRTTHHTEQRALLADAASRLGLPILGDIPRRTAVQEAAGAGVAPTRYPDTNGAADAYRTLATALLAGGSYAL